MPQPPSDIGKSLREIVDFLESYPLKEAPYPPGYPEDLQYEMYPGKDTVVGMCDEAICDCMNYLIKETNQDKRPLWQEAINLWQTIKTRRLKKLADAKIIHYTSDLYTDAVHALKR